MVQELSYNTTSYVVDSWEQVRRMKNYEEVAGAILFQRYVVLLCTCYQQHAASISSSLLLHQHSHILDAL